MSQQYLTLCMSHLYPFRLCVRTMRVLESFIFRANGLTALCLLAFSNRVIMEVVPCVSLEEEDKDSVGKVRCILFGLR